MATPAQLISGLSGYISYKEQVELGPIDVTIKKCEVESVGQGEKAEDKPVLTFVETRKKLVLNKTRLSQLAEIVGVKNEPEGTKVRLVPVAGYEINGRNFDMVILEGID